MVKVESILEKKGVKPTPNRLLVLKGLLDAGRPVSLSELEIILDSVDRSSIFRVLSLFAAHHVVHEMEDGSGMMKYEVCSGVDGCSLDDMHVHFHCEVCGTTYCLKDMRIPDVELPDGFSMESVNFMIKGICPACKEAK